MSSWAQLTHQDKEAFFSLLDEYFASRPHLLGGGQASVPLPSAATVRNVAAAVASSHNPPPPPPAAAAPTTESHSRWAPSNPHVASASNKVNDLANRFRSSSGSSPAPAASPKAAPPPPPGQRTAHAGGQLPAGLTSSKKFFGGMVSQKEKDAMYNKPRGVLAAATPRAPTERSPPNTGYPAPPSRTTAPPPPPPPPEEEEDEGDMVEALYDYNGTDADDLSFREHQIIRLAERVNEDWAKGSVDGGPVGMFPLAYTKPL